MGWFLRACALPGYRRAILGCSALVSYVPHELILVPTGGASIHRDPLLVPAPSPEPLPSMRAYASHNPSRVRPYHAPNPGGRRINRCWQHVRVRASDLSSGHAVTPEQCLELCEQSACHSFLYETTGRCVLRRSTPVGPELGSTNERAPFDRPLDSSSGETDAWAGPWCEATVADVSHDKLHQFGADAFRSEDLGGLYDSDFLDARLNDTQV